MRSLVVFPWCKHRLVSWLECEQCAALSPFTLLLLCCSLLKPLSQSHHIHTVHTHKNTHAHSLSLPLSLPHPASPVSHMNRRTFKPYNYITIMYVNCIMIWAVCHHSKSTLPHLLRTKLSVL